MNLLEAQDMLSVWEQGVPLSTLERSLLLLSRAWPQLGGRGALHLSIGRRDAGLLQLREGLFGSRLLNMADCPACLRPVEWESRTGDLRLQEFSVEDVAEDVAEEVAENGEPPNGVSERAPLIFRQAEFVLHYRLPHSGDVAAVMVSGTGAAGLLARCVVCCERGGESCGVEELPSQVKEDLIRRMAQADPQADIRINLVCPECAHRWDVPFDVGAYLWREIDDWARRMVSAVHVLAAAYGWAERDILNMSPIRRQLYLGMVRA